VEKGEGFHMIKTEAIPSFLLVLMGTIDCLTTVIGVVYSGASELNPIMAGIVSTNIGAFLAVKILGTILIALTYVIANKALMKSQNKTTKSFKISCKLLKVGYGGIITFLCIVVANNLIILLA
jgi:membrane protein DedA with SNARE-associated domain